jgi:mono/diheme cytochrome c family protein
MTRTTTIVVVISIIGAAIILAFGWFIIGRGFSAREEPSTIEAFIARRLRGLATPRAARDQQNPIDRTEEVLSEAMAHFADHCAICHANDGSGDTAIGKGLYPRPPDLRDAETQTLSDGELFYIIHNGIRFTGMPAFGEETADKPDLDSWKLVHFVRHLPSVTIEEVEQMKTMNPKSPEELKEEEAIRRFLEGDDSRPAEPSHKHH